jgi:NAD(P)-dependent dehydrogenase (short-subunit alcohol dehydrogenase family)
VAHVHGDCRDGGPVRLSLKLDRSGLAVMIALPEQATPNMEDDKTLRETSCDPKFRRVLVTDGKSAVGLATIRALLDAGATTVFAGDPDIWKKQKPFTELCQDPRIQVQALNLTDTDSVERIAGSIGGKVDILINTADYERDGGILHNHDLNKARDALDINCLGLMRLAQYFGPAMAGRAADGVNSAVAWVNNLSVYAHMNLPVRGIWSASQAAALSVSQCLRNEFRPAGIRVVNVFTGPVDHEWEQLTPPPRVRPDAIADATVRALREGTEDVYVGDVAKEFLALLHDNRKGLERELGG